MEQVKTCCRCKTSKNLNQFGLNRAMKDGLQRECKSCKVLINKASYVSTKGYQNPKRRATKDASLARAQEFVRGYLLAHPCTDCGENDIVVLQFDHQGDKLCNVANLMGGSMTKLKAEIAKCEVVCANCHVRRTAKTFGWWRTK